MLIILDLLIRKQRWIWFNTLICLIKLSADYLLTENMVHSILVIYLTINLNHVTRLRIGVQVFWHNL